MRNVQEEIERRYKDDSVDITLGRVIKWLIIAIVFIFALVIIFGSFYQINAGERGVLLRWGNPQPNAISEGLHFKIPISDAVVKMDVKTQKYESDLTAASKDLQDVKTRIAINYHLVPSTVPQLYKEIGIDYADKVIYPLEQEVNKASTAQFTAEELITRREEVRQTMKDSLKQKLAERNIIVEEISIVNFEFSPSFTQAIEQKVTQEQLALAAKNKLEQTKYEAQQRVAQAEGEANAIRIQAEAIRSQGGAEYVQLQAINKWNGILPQFMTGGSSNMLFNIPMGTQSSQA